MKFLLIALLFISCEKENVKDTTPTLAVVGVNTFQLTVPIPHKTVFMEWYKPDLLGWCPLSTTWTDSRKAVYQIVINRTDGKLQIYRASVVNMEGNNIYSNEIKYQH